MAESLVASAVQWIGSLLIQEASMLFDVADQIKGLQEELELMQQYLQDADAKQEMKEVGTLIRQIRKLAYDSEDVIDTYILEVDTKAFGDKSRFMKFACFLHTAPQTYRIGKQIQLMQSNVKRLTDRLTSYGIRRITKIGDNLRSSDQERYSRKQPRSYPYDDEGEFVVGLEKDVKKLVEVLMGEGKTHVGLISIVGMGGSGKTTLARKLYNHPYTKECFDCLAWVYISQEWSTSHVLSEILRKVIGLAGESKSYAKSSVEELVDKLRNILEKKSYLVVLDDVWRKEALEEILPALPRVNNNKGSKIIITTRNQEVVQFHNLQRNLYVHEPHPLSKDESWELFCKLAFNYHTICNNKSFEILGKEMLSRCDGLPLAIVALAGILNTKRSIKEWQQVSEAVRSRVMEYACTHLYGRVGDMLALSYDDLPCDLKPCFLYLAVFPEDCLIPAGMLTRMWIAEGLVVANAEMSPEDVAVQLLEDLSHRFMIQVVRTNFKGAIKTIHLHDLLRELCIRKAREQRFLQINTATDNSTVNNASKISIQSRRVALHSSTHFPTEVSNLRSLVLLTNSAILHSANLSKETVDLGNIHHNFKLLRLLSLWGIKTSTGTLPAQIGTLIHLRYLAVHASNITELPVSIGNLRNLLTLDYRNVDSGSNVKIPNVLCKLMLLRHLYLPIECPWNSEDLQLNALRNLQILWGVKCLGGNWFSKEMPKLSTSLKKLKVIVSTKEDLEATFSCPSIKTDRLHTFHCEWVGVTLKSENCTYSHNKHLHKLVLVGKIQVEKFSLALPSNLLILELKDSVLEDENTLAVAGALAHLKLLRLSNSYMGTVFTCNAGSFPQLEELYLENLENLTTWKIEKGTLSSLKKLEIFRCKKLQNFPKGLKFVTTLQQLEFSDVPKEFGIEARVYGWSQKRERLPHNYESIIEQCDTALNMSTIHKLYEQLTAGIYLNNNKKKFWVVKQDKHQYNCFMVYATGLSLATTVDVDGLPEWDARMHDWEWTETKERDGAMIKVAKLRSPVLVLHVSGKLNTADLSPGVVYTFSFVIMLDDSQSIEEMHVNSLLILPYGRYRFPTYGRSKRQSLKLNEKPRNEWLKVSVGEIRANSKIVGEAEFSLHCQWRQTSKIGFAIKAVVIEPKIELVEGLVS